MTDTLVDSNVIIDILDADPDWVEWSQERIRQARRHGNLIINPIVYAEVASAYATQRQADRALSKAIYRRENLPWEAAHAAGRAFLAYRREGGARRSPLPDFYIGAHADLKGYALLTRDPTCYRRHFPSLALVAPDSHP